jgi:hypothetical protein
LTWRRFEGNSAYSETKGGSLLYEYTTHQLAPKFVVNDLSREANAAATMMGDVLNKYAAEGWEYVRADTFAHEQRPGCFSKEVRTGSFHVLVFRRPKQ